MLPVSELAMPTFTPIIQETKRDVVKDDFDPKRHLAFSPPSKIYTMKELGMPEGQGISPVAVSEPFRLFSDEAIHRMREEVLTPEVLENCRYTSNLGACMIRGYANR